MKIIGINENTELEVKKHRKGLFLQIVYHFKGKFGNNIPIKGIIIDEKKAKKIQDYIRSNYAKKGKR